METNQLFFNLYHLPLLGHPKLGDDFIQEWYYINILVVINCFNQGAESLMYEDTWTNNNNKN